MRSDRASAAEGPRVALFVTCLVDLFRPSVARAAAACLRAAGCRVEIPAAQTCCGQPAYNSGDEAGSRALARHVIATFEGHDYVVAPSGSCAGMLRVHYPRLFRDDPEMLPRANALAERSFEVMSFLVDVLHAELPPASMHAQATYHDGCSGLRELGVRDQPRVLLARVDGLEIREMAETESCCGFGGTFCVKYPEISARLADDKLREALATGADLLLAGELGCLLHLEGRAARAGLSLRCAHAVEVLAQELSMQNDRESQPVAAESGEPS